MRLLLSLLQSLFWLVILRFEIKKKDEKTAAQMEFFLTKKGL